MSVCVIIYGTNGVGKTSLMKCLISRFGKKSESKTLTLLGNGWGVCGKYNDGKYGGVDRFGKTRILPQIAEEFFVDGNVLLAEGVKLHGVGNNITSTIFQAEKQLAVLVTADAKILHQRLIDRSGKGITREIIKDQLSNIKTLKKWSEMGVNTLVIDNTSASIEDNTNKLINKINELLITTMDKRGR